MKKITIWFLLCIFLVFSLSFAFAQDKKNLKIYISVDMEGMGGAVAVSEVVNGYEVKTEKPRFSDDYERFRKMLTKEVNAVVRGARMAGASEILICEAHGGSLFRNLIIEDLEDEEARLVRGWPRPEMMMTGLTEEFDVVFLIGYHANYGTKNAVLAHNYAFTSFEINGESLGEAEINALYAGEMGVPVGMVSGDDKLIAQLNRFLPDAEKVVTKEGLSGQSAIILHPKKVRKMLENTAMIVMENKKYSNKYKPFTMKKPYKVKFKLTNRFTEFADKIEKMNSGLKKTGTNSYLLTVNSMKEILKLINDIERLVL